MKFEQKKEILMTLTLTHFHNSIIRNWNYAHTMACNAYRNRDMETVNAIVEAMEIRAFSMENLDRQAVVEDELRLCIKVRDILMNELGYTYCA